MNYTSTMQFIELFRQHRALWDRHDVNYLNKAERMRQREEIGFTMGMTEVDVGKKICNLRTYYLREMVKRDRALDCGQDTADSYLPKWPYFHALDAFLQDVVRKKRNEYLTAGGSFHDLSYVYAADDHLSDNDVVLNDNFPDNDNHDMSRDSGGEGGDDGEARKPTHTNDMNASNNNNNGDSDNNDLPATKRPKLEPEEDYHPALDAEDGNVPDKDPRGGGGRESPGSYVGFGVSFPRSSPFRMQPSVPVGAQPLPSFHRFAAGAPRGPLPAQSLAQSPSSVEGPRVNGVGGGGGGGGGSSAGGSTVVGAHAGHPNSFPHRVPPAGVMMMEEDEDWLFGRYIAAELKKIKSFKDKQLTKMRIQQIVTYAQLGMREQDGSTGAVAASVADAV